MITFLSYCVFLTLMFGLGVNSNNKLACIKICFNIHRNFLKIYLLVRVIVLQSLRYEKKSITINLES